MTGFISWHEDLLSALGRGEQVIRVVLIRAEGSTPREMGADMMVYGDVFTGTIGGGALEHEVIKTARALMASPRDVYRVHRQYPLGPTLGQCCGGFVEVMFEHIMPEDRGFWSGLVGGSSIFHSGDSSLPPQVDKNGADKNEVDSIRVDSKEGGGVSVPLGQSKIPFYLYGAGHVGRAVMSVTMGMPLMRHWIDTDEARFPAVIASDIEKIIAADPSLIAGYAPEDAIHMVMSYSHQIDFAICLAVLEKNRFGRLGLIGSGTKRARFLKALSDAGIADDVSGQLVCPIGLPEIGGKEPFRVALSIAGQLSEWSR